MKFLRHKSITRNDKPFLQRLNIYLKKGSIKIHLFLQSDPAELHNHPWDFKSLLILPYKEEVQMGNYTKVLYHYPLKLVKRQADQHHRVLLYKFLGISIPALTIGHYTQKNQEWTFKNNY
jgi:hypothetical protein